MSANKKPKLRLIQGGLAEPTAPMAFDPEAVRYRITRALAARDPEMQAEAAHAVLKDAQVMLAALGSMGSAIVALRQEIKAFAQQSSDQATINSVLLAVAGGEVRVPADWFEAYEVKGGFSVTEESHPWGDEVVIRALVATPGPDGVPSISARKQTEG